MENQGIRLLEIGGVLIMLQINIKKAVVPGILN